MPLTLTIATLTTREPVSIAVDGSITLITVIFISLVITSRIVYDPVLVVRSVDEVLQVKTIALSYLAMGSMAFMEISSAEAISLFNLGLGTFVKVLVKTTTAQVCAMVAVDKIMTILR